MGTVHFSYLGMLYRYAEIHYLDTYLAPLIEFPMLLP